MNSFEIVGHCWMKPMLGWKTFSVVCGLSLFSLAAQAQPEIKFGHIGEPGSLFDQSVREFARRANERLAGRAKVAVFGFSQLGSDTELLKKLKLGTVDLALPSTVMSSHVAMFGLFEMPYLVKDRAHMERIRDQVITPTLVPAAEKEGYRIIAVWENGFRHVTNSKRPIASPDDLRGLKLRVPQGGWRVKMFQAYGADPRPMAFPEVYAALQTGAIDGQENPFAQIYPSRFQEVQKFLSLTSHVYTPAYVTAGRSWAELEPEVQKIICDVAREMQPAVAKIAAFLDEDFLHKLKDFGMKANGIDKDAFVKASRVIYDEFAKEVPEGQRLIDQALALGKRS
jgi:tripartite ATP-independent transporter DctP family solute receptor